MARRKSSRGRVFYYPSSLPKMQDGDRIGNKKGKREDVKIESVLDKGVDLEGLKEGISQAESVGGVLLMNPESTATGLYGQRFSEIKDTDLYSGTREEFSKDFEAQNAVFDKRFYEGLASTETTPLEKDAYDLYREYKPQIKNFNYSLEDLAALSNFLGRQGTRNYLGKVVRDGNTLEETFPTKFGKGAEQANKTPEEYLKITRPFYKQEDKLSDRPNSSNKPVSSIKPNPNVRTPEEVMSMLVGRDYTRTPKDSNYNPYGKVVKEIMDENKALYNVGAPKKFNIVPSDERMAQHLKKTGRGLEYLDAEDTWIPFKDRPTAKLGIPGEGANRVVINTKNIKDKDLKEAVALDILSNSMDEDETYKKYKDKINTELVNKYGQEFIDRNGGIDAYVRGILASRDNKEYQPYKEETGFLNKALVNDFKKYIKTGEEPSNGLFNFKFGGGITDDGTEDNGLIPIRVDVANESTTWNPKFTDIINNPANYSQSEVIDAVQKMSALFPDSDKIITTPGVSPSEAGIRYVEKDPATGLPKLKSGGIPERYKNKGFTKVGAKKQSTRPGKKWMVLAKKGDDYKVVHGGYKGMKDFSQHGSKDRKKKFWSRMGGKNSSKAQDPFSPLYWHKRFGTWEYGGDIQQQGYKDESPYKNRPYIDIYSNNITMDGVSQPLLVKTDTGQEMILDPNSGEYYFPGANVVREMPLKDTPLYFSPSSKGLTKYQKGGGILSEPVPEDVPTTLMPEINITGFKDNSYSFTGLPTIAPENSKSGKKCSTKNCAEQATTEFANIVGTSREEISPLVSADAWYRKSKVLSNPNNELIFEAETADYDGYKNLPVKPEGDWWKDIDFQVGDFVDLSGNVYGSWRSSKQPKLGKASKEGDSQSDFARHSGIIVGKTPEGIPIVRHNIAGKLHDEPITNITESYNYFPSAIYRVNDEALNKGKQQYSIKQQQNYENIANYSDKSLDLPFTGSVVDDKGNSLKVDTKKVNKKLVEPYKEIRKDLVANYGVSQERLDDVFKTLLAIGTQESNLDNMVDDSFKSKAKVAVLDSFNNPSIKAAKYASNVKGQIQNLLSDYEVAEIPTWKLDKEIALLGAQGVPKDEAVHQIFSQYGAPSKADKVTDPSRGPFRQKAPSGRWLNTMGEEYSTIEAMKKDNWGKEWNDSNKNYIANAIGLYLDNYDKAKKVYGENESEEFLNQVATLAHNAPTKAFTKEYTDFYIKGIDNPDPEKHNAGYVNKVYNAKNSMFRQPKSPRENNEGTYRGFIDKSTESSNQQQNANTPLVDVPSYFSGSKIGLTEYQTGGQLPKAQDNIKTAPEKADSEVYRLYLSGKHLKQGYPWAAQQGTGRAYPDAREMSPEFEYQGDKHWNVKRFAYAPFFGQTENDGYHYNNIGIYTDENYQGPTTVPLEVGKNKKEQRKLLTEDMTKYYLGSGYSEEEALNKAKTFVKDEVMPLVNSKYHKMSKNHPIKRVDQFDAPFIYSQMLITPGEKRKDNYFYDKETLKKLNEGYFKSGRKIKRLDKDFNIKFRGKSKEEAKAEAKTNYKNFKDSKYTISDFKKDKKERSSQNPLSDGGKSLFQEYQNGGSLPKAQEGMGGLGSTFNSPQDTRYMGFDMQNFSKPLIKTSDPYDPKLLNFNDSLYLANKSNSLYNLENQKDKIIPWEQASRLPRDNNFEKYMDPSGNITPIGAIVEREKGKKTATMPVYKYPTQPYLLVDDLVKINPEKIQRKEYVTMQNNPDIEKVPEEKVPYKKESAWYQRTGFNSQPVRIQPSNYDPDAPYWRGEPFQKEYQTGGQLPRAEVMTDPATGLPKLKKGGKAWIQGAIKKPGSLKATAKRAGAIKSDGTIKKSWLREKARGKGKTAQRARLAITLGKMKK